MPGQWFGVRTRSGRSKLMVGTLDFSPLEGAVVTESGDVVCHVFSDEESQILDHFRELPGFRKLVHALTIFGQKMEKVQTHQHDMHRKQVKHGSIA